MCSRRQWTQGKSVIIGTETRSTNIENVSPHTDETCYQHILFDKKADSTYKVCSTYSRYINDTCRKKIYENIGRQFRNTDCVCITTKSKDEGSPHRLLGFCSVNPLRP